MESSRDKAPTSRYRNRLYSSEAPSFTFRRRANIYPSTPSNLVKGSESLRSRGKRGLGVDHARAVRQRHSCCCRGIG